MFNWGLMNEFVIGNETIVIDKLCWWLTKYVRLKHVLSIWYNFDNFRVSFFCMKLCNGWLACVYYVINQPIKGCAYLGNVWVATKFRNYICF